MAFYPCAQSAVPPGYLIEWGWCSATAKAFPPKLVGSNIVDMAISRLHRVALVKDGTVIEWGDNSPGAAFGDVLADPIIKSEPVIIDGQKLSNIVSVATGDLFGMGLKHDGTIVEWGDQAVSGVDKAIAIAATSDFSFALKPDGTIVEWVNDKSLRQYGQIVPVSDTTNVVALSVCEAANGYRNVFLRNDHSVGHWGNETIFKDATPPSDLTSVLAVVAGYGHSLALRGDGTVCGWGFNDVGQATGVPIKSGLNSTAYGNVMLQGVILSNVVAVAANNGYSLALQKNGTIISWGRMINNLYPAYVPSGLSNVVAIAAADDVCLAITTNKAVCDRVIKP